MERPNDEVNINVDRYSSGHCTIKEVLQSRIREIKRAAHNEDDERACELEYDMLMLTLDQIIQNLSANSRIRQWAEIAISSKDIDFDRPY